MKKLILLSACLMLLGAGCVEKSCDKVFNKLEIIIENQEYINKTLEEHDAWVKNQLAKKNHTNTFEVINGQYLCVEDEQIELQEGEVMVARKLDDKLIYQIWGSSTK